MKSVEADLSLYYQRIRVHKVTPYNFILKCIYIYLPMHFKLSTCNYIVVYNLKDCWFNNNKKTLDSQFAEIKTRLSGLNINFVLFDKE